VVRNVELILQIHANNSSGSNSQKTKCLDIINVNRLMLLLLGEIAIYFEAHAKDTNKRCEQIEEFCSIKHLVHRVGENRLLWGGCLVWGSAIFHNKTAAICA